MTGMVEMARDINRVMIGQDNYPALFVMYHRDSQNYTDKEKI